MDGILNLLGHQSGTAEVESVLVAHPSVVHAADVGIPYTIKGQGICCFTTLTEGFVESTESVKELLSEQRVTREDKKVDDLDMNMIANIVP